MFLKTIGIIVSKVTDFDLSNVADSNTRDFLPKYLKCREQDGLKGGGRVLVAVIWVFRKLFCKPLPEFRTRRPEFNDHIKSLRFLRILGTIPEGKKYLNSGTLFYFLVNYNFILGYKRQGKLGHALYINPRNIK